MFVQTYISWNDHPLYCMENKFRKLQKMGCAAREARAAGLGSVRSWPRALRARRTPSFAFFVFFVWKSKTETFNARDMGCAAREARVAGLGGVRSWPRGLRARRIPLFTINSERLTDPLAFCSPRNNGKVY